MEDLKQLWQQYDEKLQRTQALNEQLLRKINTRHSSDRIQKLRNTEYIGLLLLGGMLLFLITRAGEVGSHRIVQISYSLVVAQIAGWALWSMRKLSFLSGLDLSKLPVTEALSRISRFRLMLMREKLWGGLSALLFLLVPGNVLVDYWMGGELPLLENPVRYVLRMVPYVIIGAGAGLWAYRKYYGDPVREIMESLREIEDLKRS